MRNTAIREDQLRIEALFASASGFDTGSTPQSHLTEHLCVRLSGFIEQSVRSILYDYATQTGHLTLAEFVNRVIERHYQNLNHERICELLTRFDSVWATQMRTYLTDEHKMAIGSILANRNKISHGEPVPTLGLTQLRQWYQKVLEVLDYLEAIAR